MDRAKGANATKGSFVLAGAGTALPEHRLDNETLGKRLGMDPEGIFQRTGIRERRVAVEGESASMLGTRAAQAALARAGVEGKDIDLVVLSTYTPDHLMCPSSPALATAIGADRAGVFDLNAACSGGVTAIATAATMLEGSLFKRILVVTSDLSSFFVRPDDPKTSMVFGDGASAMVLERPNGQMDVKRPWEILAVSMGSDGTGAKMFWVPDGGSARPPINGFKLNPTRTIEMNGRAVFRFAVDRAAQVVDDLCAQAGLQPNEVDYVVPHQANMRIITALAERTAIPTERFFTNLQDYGNTASSSVPIALTELLDTKRVKPGDNVLLVAFGAGLTWSGIALRAGSALWTG
jgi:3-oxoacyl-[acyl-carrier-protein] synthase-3